MQLLDRVASPSLDDVIAYAEVHGGPEGADLIRRAYALAELAHAGQFRNSGEPYIIHPIAVAGILKSLNMDVATIAAGLLHDVLEDSTYTREQLAEELGEDVTRLVEGMTKLKLIEDMTGHPYEDEAESFRKMFLAMADDMRVVLIKLADRLHNMRTVDSLAPDRQERLSKETLDIWAPLANRLGIWQVKWELEDISFAHLHPDKYREIDAWLNQTRAEREAAVHDTIELLRSKLAESNIEADISGRPKHIYSIVKKMERKGVTHEQVYDVRAVRVIVTDIPSCYVTLGIVHSLWTPIPGEFDDYIARPKDNLYQSLHTAVIGPEGKPLEVQIRTRAMHEIAEFGVAAHWRYKEGGKHLDQNVEAKINWLRQLMEWRKEISDPGAFLDSLKTDIFQDQVYVFTPRGKIIELPAGATPIDFAYQIHTDIGNRCRGGRVNGKLVNLDYRLQNGEQVEIITAKRGGPSRDWLNPHLEFVRTARARTKIRQWFRQQDREENIAAGRDLLERELNRLGIDNVTYEVIAGLFGIEKVDDLLANVGTGDITTVQVADKVLNIGKVEEPARKATEELKTQEGPQKPAMSVDGIAVQGVGNLLTVLARCCNPMPPDDIVGFVTRGRGVSVHRRECPNVVALTDKERLIEVDWGTVTTEAMPGLLRVKIRVQAYDRAGLLADITRIIQEEKINLGDASAVTARQDNLAIITATLEVRNAEQLSRVLSRIDRLPNVVSVKRQAG